MRIACPSCAATYDVPDRLLAGPARTLRCSRCGADFPLPKTEAEAPEPPPPEPPSLAERVTPAPAAEAPVPLEARPEPLAPPRRAVATLDETPPPTALRRAWAASIAVVVAAVIALLVFHAKVMEVWPASTRLFAALGLA
jgi:predicted Zn finger-like uncharacterized protein